MTAKEKVLWSALDRLRKNAQRIFDKKPVRDWAETLAEADAALATVDAAESLPAEPEHVMFPIDRECVKCAHQFKGTWTTLCPNCEVEPKPTSSTPNEPNKYPPDGYEFICDGSRLGLFPKPQPASFSSEFEERFMEGQYELVEYNTAWQASIGLGEEYEDAFRAGFDAAWAAAKGSTDTEGR